MCDWPIGPIPFTERFSFPYYTALILLYTLISLYTYGFRSRHCILVYGPTWHIPMPYWPLQCWARWLCSFSALFRILLLSQISLFPYLFLCKSLHTLGNRASFTMRNLIETLGWLPWWQIHGGGKWSNKKKVSEQRLPQTGWCPPMLVTWSPKARVMVFGDRTLESNRMKSWGWQL